MSAPFTFPPPPPPPPKAAPDPGYGDNFASTQGQGGRGGRGSFRGRGRGNFQRGNASGAFAAQPFQGFPGGAGYQQQQPMMGQPAYPMNYAHQVQAQSYQQQAYPHHAQSPYPPMQAAPSSFQAPFMYPNQGYGQASYAATSQYPNQAGYGFPQQAWNQPMQQSQSPPPPMGPPIRYGFGPGQNQSPSNYQVPVQGNPAFETKRKRDGNFESRGTSNNGRFQKGNNPNARPQKRAKVEAPPAIPSFGAPLPVQVFSEAANSSDVANANKNKKKKRKTNQLGLTPAGEEHESSEEEVDEEALFAAVGGPLKFEYRGKTSVLGTSADIAAWIEERKKKFPTKARVEEKQAELQKRRQEQAEARKKAQEAQAEARKKAQDEARKVADASRPEFVGNAEQSLPAPSEMTKEKNADDKTKKALERHLAKAEKLRKKLEKSQARADKAAAALGVATQSGHASVEKVPQSHDNEVEVLNTTSSFEGEAIKIGTVIEEAPVLPKAIVDTVTVSEEPLEALEAALDASLNAAGTESEALMTGSEELKGREDSATKVSEALSVSSDSASDSDSELSSDSDSDNDSSSDSSPEETSTKAAGPVRVPPPKRESNARVCRYFLAKGRCTMGDRCKFKHELPDRGAGTKAANAANASEAKKEKQSTGKEKPRKTLFQALVEQEQAEENKLVLKAIKYLGQTGILQGKSQD